MSKKKAIDKVKKHSSEKGEKRQLKNAGENKKKKNNYKQKVPYFVFTPTEKEWSISIGANKKKTSLKKKKDKKAKDAHEQTH